MQHSLYKEFGDDGYYFHFEPSFKRPSLKQRQFHALDPNFPLMPDPLPSIRSHALYRLLLPYEKRGFFSLMFYKEYAGYFSHGLIINLLDDYIDGVLYSLVSLDDFESNIFPMMKLIQHLGGFALYDYQLKRYIDLKYEAPLIRELYAQDRWKRN